MLGGEGPYDTTCFHAQQAIEKALKILLGCLTLHMTRRRTVIIVDMDLYDYSMQRRLKNEAPLAALKRPRGLNEYIGEELIVGPGKLRRRAIDAERLFSSSILFGSPGTGKTTLAQVIANRTRSHFETLSACYLRWRQ